MNPDKTTTIYSLVRQFVASSIIHLEKTLYRLCEKSNVKINLQHPQIFIILNQLVEDYINSLYHKISNSSFDDKDEIIELFNEIRSVMLFHPFCILDIMLKMIANIYTKIDRSKLNITDLEVYQQSFKYQLDMIIIYIKTDVTNSIKECTDSCRIQYDRNVDPFKFGIEWASKSGDDDDTGDDDAGDDDPGLESE
jgi:hypothetical protein